jgi:hypothetical protein
MLVCTVPGIWPRFTILEARSSKRRMRSIRRCISSRSESSGVEPLPMLPLWPVVLGTSGDAEAPVGVVNRVS